MAESPILACLENIVFHESKLLSNNFPSNMVWAHSILSDFACILTIAIPRWRLEINHVQIKCPWILFPRSRFPICPQANNKPKNVIQFGKKSPTLFMDEKRLNASAQLPFHAYVVINEFQDTISFWDVTQNAFPKIYLSNLNIHWNQGIQLETHEPTLPISGFPIHHKP